MSRIAIVGMAGRFPGAPDVAALWRVLAEGRETLTVFSEDELRAAGVPPSLLADPAYVRSRGLIDGPDLFDAALFGFNPREADVTDPQHRLLLENAWTALEHAGYDPRRYPGLIGVFAGAGSNTYLLFNLARNREVVDQVGMYQAMLGSDGDFLATRISYKLGLRGPALTVQTACSTSLVAVHLACQSLIHGECDMALAGGVRISVPQRAGYLYQQGGIFSPDGHCRPFDAAAQGSLDGDGVGLVVLKRLDDALADGDHIHGVILGSAINNDGSAKIGYTAPSSEGQAEVISLAQALAGVEAASIGYVEAHGTATPLGDPIEVAALKQVFAEVPPASCVLGSVKSNFGHLDAAAGVTSLIKATLALEHGEIPPTVHFERPNPGLGLEDSPFVVSSSVMAFQETGEPRRAGVSSFGIGGTNAHVILEEAPEPEGSGPSRSHQLLLLSAATESALETATVNLAARLPEVDLADAAYTLQVGRRLLSHRRMVVCPDAADAVETLGALDPRRVLTRVEEAEDRPVVFLFPGQGAQYPGMAEALYRSEPTFREQIDLCADVLRAEGIDLLQALYPPGDRGPEAADRLRQTAMAQVSIFAVEHALARLWMEWGVVPAAMIGHSVGEYVAACLAGVFSVEDAVRLVAERGRLMQAMPTGAMLSVPLSEEELRPLLPEGVEIAAVNGPALCVASGPAAAIEELERKVGDSRRLHTSHAFHSPMMEPVLDRFAAAISGVSGLDLQAPSIPWVSNLTGTWITDEEAVDPRYWTRHLRRTVRFSAGLETLFEQGNAVLLEVGPGRALSSLARRHPGRPGGQTVLSSLPAAPDAGDEDLPVLLRALGQLWLSGVPVDWQGFHIHERRRRVVLPTYPFEGRRHWVEPKEDRASSTLDSPDRTWAPLWKQALPPRPAGGDGPWLVLLDESDVGERLVRLLESQGRPVTAARPPFDYPALLAELPRRIVHFGEAFESLLALARALGERGAGAPLDVAVVSSGLQDVESADEPDPMKALLLGIVLTLPQELPGVTSRSVDVNRRVPVEALLAELEADEPIVALRGAGRWVRAWEPVVLDPGPPPLRERGVYLITGGSGGVGLEIARFLARTVRARLVLVSRSSVNQDRIAELEALGAEVLAVGADVTRRDAMASALSSARERFGEVHGVIHAAGVPGSGVMQLTAAEAAANVLAPKVRGTIILDELLRDSEADFLVLCSSLSAVLGGPGQADYAAANAFLDAFARSRALSSGPRVIAIDWDTWLGIGMAGMAAPAAKPQPAVSDPQPLAHPLLQQRTMGDREDVFLSRFRTGETWVLDEHRLGGHPIVPGTTWLEMAGAAFREAAGNGHGFEMRDVMFVAPLRVGDGETKEVRTVLRRESDAFRFSVASDGQEHALGTILPLHSAPASVDLGGLQSAAHTATVLGEEYREDLRTAGLGPRWESLRKVWVGDGYVLGYLELAPELGGDVERFGLHPALMDVATSFGESHVPAGSKGEGHYLPLSYKRLLAHGPLPRKAWSWVRFGPPSPETLSFDITILDEQGTERVRVEEFVLKRLDVAQTMRARSEPRAEARQQSEEGTEGMTAAEAVELLRRILAGPRLPQVAVSALPLPQVIESRRRLARDLAEGKTVSGTGGHARPDVATAYVAPRNELEARLAAIWQEILGIEPVGAFDDFFELGGHSLLGTQLVSRLRSELKVDLPLSRLFEAPVLADLAAAIGGAGTVREEAIPVVPRPSDLSDGLPLSFAQERLWFLDQLDPGNPFYNVSQAVRMEGALDLGRLFASLDGIVRRHEVLRTAFTSVHGRPVQRVLSEAKPILLLADLSGLPEAAREAEARGLLARAAEVAFDLTRPPLFATTLFRLAPDHHVCVLTLHHIVSDGWSIGVLISELAALYRSFALDQPPLLAPLPVQYADFAHWQRNALEQETAERQLAYWRRQLAGPLPVLELPTDHPRPAVQTFRGAAEHLALPAGLTAQLKALCNREGATPFMGLLASFALLLHGAGGQTDILIGTPIAGRNRKEVEGLIGVFLNTLVLRVDLAGAPGFRELLKRVRAMVLAAYSNQDVPIEKLLQEIRPDRDLSRASLFQVFFNMQDFPRRELELPGLTLTSLPIREVPAKFDLTVYAAEVDGEILFELIYNADLFERRTAVGLLARFQALIESAVAAPDTTIDLLAAPKAPKELPGVGPDWSFPERCLHRLFEEQAARTPDATALVCGDGTLSYRELDARADRVARFLRQHGVGPERRVAASFGRSLDLAVAILGILKAGGAYVVVDPEQPEARRDRILADARPDLVLGPGPLPGLDGEGFDSEVQPENLAWITYTSGSTGVPKGIQAPHRGAVNYLTWVADLVDLGPADVVLQVAAPTFDASVRDLIGPLLVGATVVLLPEGTRDPATALEAIQRHRVTAVLSAVPTLLRSWLAASPSSPITDFSSLTRLLVSGEMLYLADRDRAREVFGPQLEVINHYGPTECTMTTTFAPLSKVAGGVGGEGPAPVGRPVGNARVVLVDGEVHIAGTGLTRGYWDRPDLTAEAFVPDPSDPEGGGRLYRTGDLGRFLPDGSLEVLGRRDLQVKIRGNRVELGEIESILASHPGVRAAAAAVRDERLIAWVVPRPEQPGQDPGAAELRRFLAERLPEYMLPQTFVALDALPLTHTGKLDRAALPAPPAQEDREGEALRPLTPLEEIVSAVFCELLGLARVGPDESFFELGGHSLLAIQVVARFRETLGVEVPVRRLFETPTVAGLARQIEQEMRSGLAAPPLLEQTPREGRLPLSFAQERLWVLDRLTPGSAAWHMPLSLRLTGNLDPRVLEASLTEVVRRHAALRAVFSEEDGVPFQVTAPASLFLLPVADLRALPAEAARTETERRTDEEARRPFDLGSHGPRLRGLLLRLDTDDWRLLLVMHHIASDGWSLGVLVRETAALYGAFRQGRPSPLPELPVQYADYASWQRGWLRGEALQEQLAWWRRELDGAPTVLELPADRPRPPVQSDRGAREPLSLAGLAEGVAALARREGATPFMVLLAAFQALLSRLTGLDDLLVGTPVANRTRVELEGLIGFFVNTLVLRGRPGAETFRGFLAQVRTAALGAFAHQDLPFDRLVEELAVERSLSRHPLIQVMLALQVPTVTALDLPDLALEPSRVDIGTSQLDLSLDLDAGLRGTVEYSVDLFDRPRIVRLASHLETLLAAALADPDRPVRELPLLSGEEEAQLLDWSHSAPARLDGLVPDLVRARASESPDAEAVAAADGVLTYAELVARSGRLAGRLRRLGIGGMHTEEAVGVLLERSAGAVVALLGILEAGAVYLPLDPAYPAARLAGMLADAGARFVVTTQGMTGLPAGIEPVWLEDEDGGGEEVRVPVHPQQAAYVIYTSGSTGRPKGVIVSHGAIAAHCASWIGLYRLGPGDRVLQFAAPGFDASIEQLLPTLAAGATVVPRGTELWLPADFLRHCRELGLTAADLPAAWCARWIQEAADLDEPAPAGLRLISVGGEELPAEAARRWSRTPLAGLPLFNAYGPTEAVISATGGEVREGETGPVPIGRPIPGHTVRILDRGGRPAPAGVPGELCLGGLLARGYLGRPAETAERFVPDPWADDPGERLYRTGDLASWREDGLLRFLGRIDHQIKVRGVRIEPGEVESALLALPGVREAAVALADGRLVAWLGVGMAGQIAEPAALRGLLGGRLPEAMIPSEIVLLDALPVTPSGKVDRKALPAPSRKHRAGDGEPPRTPVEEILAAIWSDLLGVERASRDLGFFAAGGHSLLATQAISQVRRRLGVELPLRALFEAPTPAELAARVEAALVGRAAGETGAAPPLAPVRRTGPLPLSFPQERLWFLDRLEAGSSTYHITGALGLRGDLDVPALRRAVAAMVRRHESLRTTFDEGEDGRPVQRVEPGLEISLPVIDLRGVDEPARSVEWERRMEDALRQPFDLGRGPLLRIALMRLGDRDWRLALAMHHIVSDGWSMEVFTRDLTALYSAFANGLSSPLPELPVQYGDHAVWQRQWLSREVREALLSFWRARLAGVQRLRLPTDRPRPSVPSSRAGHALAILPAEVVQALETLGRGQGATLFMTLLAGLQVVLGRHAAQTDFAIGTPVANRDRSEVQELIGLFLNTLALRAELEGNPSFDQLLARVRVATLEAFAHQALPFEVILEELQPERRLDRTPLFDVLFNFLRFGSGDRHTVAHGLEIEDLATAEPAAKLDLTLYAIPDGERLRLAAVFRSDLFDGSTVERLLAHLGRLLAAAAERPGTPLSALPLLGEAEREQLARAGNRIGPRNGFTPWTDAGTSIPARFALQAALHPEAPAVVSRGHRGHRWSYAELDRRSDRIAGAILESCGPGEGRVALLFDHDAPMPAAVLGALKAGKTYVPLDPSYPPERLAYMLEDSQSGLLLVRAGLEEAAHRLADNRLPVLVVGGGGDEDGPSEPVRVEVSPETPAYILYTSGSTGRPKGVVQSHRNALHHCRAYSHALRLHAGDRLSLLASYSFDAAVMDIFGALLNGAALCLLDLKSAGLAAVPAWLAEQAITVYHSTPTVFRYVAAALDGQTAPSSLRLAVLGGEAATRHDLELFRRAFPPGCLLVNGLGPTESTLALQLFADADTRVSGATVPVGYAVEGTAVDLVDERGEPVDVLAPGEIVIRSPYVALGYWRQPEMTAAAFRDEPDGGRSYRTGDLGRRLLDGSLEFLGRRDHQVKIRGQRVEIEEIEATLARCPGVVSAAVAAIAGGEGDGELRLVGYCVPRPGAELTPERLRAFARESLPEAMVPAAFVVLPELPLTPTRKVDRAALPAPDLSLVMDAAGFAAPRTPAEEVLAAIWREVLKLDRVGVETGFFDLGGHSLLAMQVISRVRSAFGVDLPLRALFEAPTVAGLAARLDEARGAAPADIPPLEPTGADRGPLSFTQERLWFLDRLEPGSAAYHIPAAMRITGDLDPEVLARTFAEIVRRHDVLRTTFAEDETPVQVVAPELPLPLETVDLRGLSSEADRRLTEEVRRPFDLVRGPLVRALLLRLDEAEWNLAVVMHHIVSDGWSLGVMIRETAELYTAFRQGLPSPLPGLPVQYLDYAVWQRSWLQGEALEAQLAWWRRELEGAPAVLELPADRPRPAVRSPRGGSARISLPPELTRALGNVARREGATPFMLLMAAFQTLLHRTGGQDDVLVGTPIANRSRVELEGLIGFFANTLVLRGRFGGESLTFRRLLERTRSSALGAFAHQDLPFERLVEELAVERSLSHNPLFQAAMALQNLPARSLELPGAVLEQQPFEAGAVKFDLDLTWTEDAGRLEGTLSYAADLFDAPTALRLLGQLRTLLEGIAAEPGARIADLPLLGEAERHQVLVEWHDTAVEREEATLHGLIEAQATRTPEAVAVAFAGISRTLLTYRELDRRADALARRLRALGVGPEARVGICAERSLELVVGLLGILKAGGAYVPLDPGYPDGRLAVLLEDAKAGVVLVQADLQERLRSLAPEESRLVDLGETTAEGDGRVESRVGSDNAAYVIFTSGSTGRPKGAVNTHRAIVNRLLWMQKAYGLTPADRVLQKTPFSFDVSVWELFWPLLTGARLVVARPGEHQDAAELVRTIAREEITHIHFVPSMLRAFLEEPELERCRVLRRVITSGEALPLDLARDFHAWLGRPFGVELHNLYGPTEAAVDVTYHACLQDEERVPIGRPVDGVRLRILDRDGGLVPPGVAGELGLGGVQLARGYVGRPDLTAERFVPDPFGEPGARLYRTGDLARYLPDGEVEYLGRIDNQVKLRGFRIELGEIEAALSGHPEVREAVVLARPAQGSAGPRLVACVSLRGAQDLDTLRAHLARSLPAWMVPSDWVVLDALPLTPNGKVDRKALERMAPTASDTAAGEPPAGPVEELVAGIWAGLLGRETVSRGDDFFALGGHSLLATRVISRVRRALGVEIPLRLLFESPTLAGFARAVESARRSALPDVEPLIPLPPKVRGSALPLSFAQERLWFLDRLLPKSPLYNVPTALRARGDLDVPAFTAAVRQVAGRHEILRTTYGAEDGRPVQRIASDLSIPVPEIDLRGLSPEVREAEARRLATEEARRPFDLGTGPLLRVVLVRTADAELLVLATFHHIVADGWSLDVFVRDLAAFYQGEALPPLPVQYADYAAWQRRRLAGEALEAELAHWRQALAGAPAVLELPADKPRPAVLTYRGGREDFRLSAELAGQAAALGRRHDATPFMVLLAVFDILLARLTGREDLVVGTPVANRDRMETEGLVGFFMNTLALRTSLAGEPGLAGLLPRVRETALAAYAHQELPFEKLVEELKPARDLAHAPLVQVTFTLVSSGARASLPGVALEPAFDDAPGTGTARFDLTLNLEGRADGHEGLAGSLEHNRDLFEPATVRRLAAHFANLLGAALADPERSLWELPLLTAEERGQLLGEWNDTAEPLPALPAETAVHRWIEEQARRRPGAVALEHADRRLTYAELDERAGRLARRLRALGVGPERCVGLCVERSAEMVVALLAVMKTGGAWLPLDPAHPRERLARILEDAGRPLMIASRSERGTELAEIAADVLWLDEDGEAPDGPEPDALLDADGLAYVIFTSGSTGRPKGVQVVRRGLANFLAAMRRRPGLGPDDVLVAVTTLSFDISGLELLLPLTVGARVVVAGREAVADGLRLAALLTRSGATAMQATPATWRLLLESGWEAPAGFKVLCGGEALPGELAARLGTRGAEVWNLYGPTETTIWSAVEPVDEGTAANRPVIPLGRPIANTTIHLAGRGLELVPAGVPGELLIGGAGLARGYLGRPDLTAERFVPDPWGPPGSRVYRTGDLARRLPDGRVEFLGRLDHQVKIRGYRIELGEIEAALAEHPAVRHAVVVDLPDPAGSRRLVAYAEVAGTAPGLDELRAFLRARLPEYMLPAAFVPLERLPLNPSGKVDRRALPDPSPERPALAVEFVAPREGREAALAALWCEALGVERVGIHDNFFDLGGHSLLLMRLQARIAAEIGIDLPVLELFEHPTVASLARRLDELGAGRTERPEETAVDERTEELRRGRERRARRAARRASDVEI